MRVCVCVCVCECVCVCVGGGGVLAQKRCVFFHGEAEIFHKFSNYILLSRKLNLCQLVHVSSEEY